MKIELIKSVNEFLSLIHQTENFENNWYRGHKETDFRLEPTLYREKKQVLTGDEHFQVRHFEVEDEEFLINEFKTKLPLTINDYTPSDLDYLYLMQHNGIKTRLLDFTTNPLIALFFSVFESKDIKKESEDFTRRDEFDENCSSVFCINPKIVNKVSFGVESVVDLSFLNFDEVRFLQTPVCIEPKNTKIDKRIEAQFGKFVLFGKEVNPLDWYDVPRKKMLKILIPNSKREKILNELNRKYGLNSESVYPDTGIPTNQIDKIKLDLKGKYKKL
ncbi:FRG domain-containing protein [Flavobacterium sp. CFBP9031]|uniref:FRG domain-containing protein n=1 Tax=unclassified Flavobacterium TaxID=196869 RepID=UPI002A6AC830|nr:FRG domain-containing protein [Flavobacterium sp. CFBP9031]MDY0990243.1 FRG domain-containing protein [Flavobacterium sp. CFBP9031]